MVNRMVWSLSSLLSGRIQQSGSSLIDASSVPAAASSLFSAIPILAVPALFLATLGGGVFGSSMYEGASSNGSSLSNVSETFPDPDARPATLKSVTHIENDVYEVVVYSHAMGREVKNEVILPGGPDNDTSRPTFYLLMGADGAANGWSWRNSSDYQDFFQDKLVNVVTPIGSVSSMQADWYREDEATGRNKWLTYFTKELPPLMDEYFHGNGRDAIAGISMSGGPALHIASLDTERFRAAASYSGCPATSGVLGDTYVRQALKLNGADATKMWGLSSNPAWEAHSPVLHLGALEDTKLFVSAAQGVPGEIDDTKTSSERIGPPVAIEAASYACSDYFVDQAQRAGLDVEWYPQVEGTHSWGLFEKSMRKSWGVIGPALDVQPFERETPVTKAPLPEEAPQPVGGSEKGSSGSSE
ncbi:alpha/beta hydrolase [Corynebacterium fournieri]|uniref:alpha/beta hydrolase n=1 Tax=Corynebacterium fournieri TaxID=1852390 RepID=UPI001E35CE57|nr:alpha/beta hydrolase family protein [Corynebacterium fournieri]WJY97433.1 Diacylglycerol acyltransferase/mycolyltransferase Ag85C precursor [Corynebacterium fournieri]